MTYQSWRRWGYVSGLGYLRCGPSATQQQAEATQVQTSQQQLQLAEHQQQLSDQQYAQYQKDVQPLESQLTALASGDRNAALSASMPVVSQVSGGYDAAKQQILDRIPPGVARDTALSNLEVTKATTVAGTQANLVEQAPKELAALGSGMGSFSLQELGAALSGYSGTTSSAGAVAQEENAAQANKFGLIGNVAGAVGGAAGSALGKPSDERVKCNIWPAYPMLDKLLSARIVKFDYLPEFGRPNQIGVIAQEIREVIPECVAPNVDGILTVDWSMLAAVTVKAVQELTERVKGLESELEEARATTRGTGGG